MMPALPHNTSTCNHAPGTGATCNHGAVGAHFAGRTYVQPAANGADRTADMRDGDDDQGTTAPVPPHTGAP